MSDSHTQVFIYLVRWIILEDKNQMYKATNWYKNGYSIFARKIACVLHGSQRLTYTST